MGGVAGQICDFSVTLRGATATIRPPLKKKKKKKKKRPAPPRERERLADTARTLADVSREIAHWVPILRRLAEAEQLRDLAPGHTSEINGAAIRSIISARRLRDQYIWLAMSEAAWALLLELFADRLEGERLDVAGLSAATEIPLASALHWIEWLSGRGRSSRYGQEEGEDAERGRWSSSPKPSL